MTVGYWDKERHIDQLTRNESPEVNIRIYDQLVFEKKNKTRQNLPHLMEKE